MVRFNSKVHNSTMITLSSITCNKTKLQ